MLIEVNEWHRGLGVLLLTQTYLGFSQSLFYLTNGFYLSYFCVAMEEPEIKPKQLLNIWT